MTCRLHINVDHVATIRNARGTSYPDPVRAAKICIAAGADGITAHLREDRRHIVDADLVGLRAVVRNTLNLEMAATDEMIAIACSLRPDVVTLVPERREERTTEGGLDAVAGGESLARRVRSLLDAGLRVSLFVAPDETQIGRAQALGVQQIELHTGDYAHAKGDKSAELARLDCGARQARALGLEVAAGHGLTVDNVEGVMVIAEITELNIGHAVIADALFLSLDLAVRAMRDAMDRGLARRS